MLPEKLELNKNGTEEFDYKKTYEKCFVDISEELQRPPTALSIGTHSYKGQFYPNPTFTYGEMSAIVAPQKTKKTFFKAALIASYIGGNSTNHFPEMKTHRGDLGFEPFILDFDTEQGKYYAQRAFRMVAEMVGFPYRNYLPFGIKNLTDDERVLFIDGVMNDPRFKGKIKWASIDGVADLCENTNDITKSKQVAQKMMKWNEEGLHLNGIIHKTFEKERAVGHLGSFVQKKAESVIFLHSMDNEEKNSPIRVRQKDSRGAPFEDFYFDLDLETVLPKECDNEIY